MMITITLSLCIRRPSYDIFLSPLPRLLALLPPLEVELDNAIM